MFLLGVVVGRSRGLHGAFVDHGPSELGRTVAESFGLDAGAEHVVLGTWTTVFVAVVELVDG